MKKGIVLHILTLSLTFTGYKALAQSWNSLPDFAGPAREATGYFSLDTNSDGIPDIGFVSCGWNGSIDFNDLWEYEPTTKTWSQEASLPAIARRSLVITVINNIAYTTTGAEGVGVDGDFLNDVWAYNYSTNTWTQKNNFPGGARWASTFFTLNGMGYLVCGDEGSVSEPSYQNDVWQYDPVNDTWTQKNNFPGLPRTALGSFTLDTNGDGVPDLGYIACGATTSEYTSEMWEYDPTTDSWTEKANVPGQARVFLTCVVADNNAYVGLGADASGDNLSDFYEYNQIQDSWQEISNIPTSGRNGAFDFTIGDTAYVGGGYGTALLSDFYKYSPVMVVYDTVTTTICIGQSYDGYTAGGTYVDSFIEANGNDSIRTLNLTVLQSSKIDETVTICDGESFNGYNQTGIYSDTLTEANGCDSTYNLNLTVLPVKHDITNQIICAGQSYEGHAISGTYTDSVTSSNGCDSFHILYLTVLPSVTDTETATICQGQSYDGYTASGTYFDTLSSSGGCDSIRSLNLTVVLTSPDTISQTICPGHSYEGHTASGTYTDTFTSINGCDSIRLLNLTVSDYNTGLVKTNICIGDTFEGHTTSGIYYDTIASITGCDTINMVELNVTPRPDTPVIEQYGNTLLSSTAVKYQWYVGGIALSGDTGQSLVITYGGAYTVQVWDSSGCSSSSAMILADMTGIEDPSSMDNTMTLYPNPTDRQFTISFDKPISDKVDLSLQDMTGRVIWHESINNVPAGPMFIDPGEISKGIYIFTVHSAGKQLTNKLVVE